MKKLTLLLTGIIFTFLQLQSQAPDTLWTRCYGGTEYDGAFSNETSFDSCYVIAGISESSDGDVYENNGFTDYWILKINKNGDTLWTKVIGSQFDETASCIKQTPDSGYIIAGYNVLYGPPYSERMMDYYIVKLNPLGDTIWTRCYGGTGDEWAESIDVVNNDGFIVAGYSDSRDGDLSGKNCTGNGWIVRLDNNGDTLWTRLFGSDRIYSDAPSIIKTENNNFMCVGNGENATYDFKIEIYDSLGQLLVEKYFGGSNWDVPESVIETHDHNFVIAGESRSNDGDVGQNKGVFDIWIIKIDSLGNLIWSKTFGGSSTDQSRSLVQCQDSGFIVVGYSNSNDGDVYENHGEDDCWVIKLNSEGELLWSKILGGSQDDYGMSISIDKENDYLIAGLTASNDGDVHGNHGGYDYWIIKMENDSGLYSCPLPLSLSTNNITPSSVNLNWIEKSNALSWEIKFGTTDTYFEELTSETVNENPYTTFGLVPETEYKWYVRSICPGGGYSYWAGPKYFTTSSTQPINLKVTNITSTSADLLWTEVYNATTWQIKLGPVGTDTTSFIDKITNENSFTWQGLLPETDYKFYVRSIGENNDNSHWSGPVYFNTLSDGLLLSKTLSVGYRVGGMAKTSDSGAVVACNDFTIVKINSEGVPEWIKDYGGTASSIQQTLDGGYIVAGRSESNDGDVHGNHGSFDFWLIKLDENGDTTWTKSIGGSKSDVAESVMQTDDNGYIVAGFTESTDGDINFNHGQYDFCVAKLDEDGNTIWVKTYGGAEYDLAYDLLQDFDNNFIISGRSYSNDGDVSGNNGGTDIWILKIDISGNIIWDKNIGGSGSEKIYSVIQSNDSCYLFTGFTYSNDGDINGHHGGGDFIVLKVDRDGNIVWNKTYGGSKKDWAIDIIQTNDFGYLITGFSQSSDGDVKINKGNEDAWLVKLNEFGDCIWTKAIGGSNNDILETVIQNTNNDYLLAGYTGSNDGDCYGNKHQGIWIVKLDGNWIPPIILPFTEDWEACSGTTKTNNDTIYKGTYHNWLFETDKPNQGRARWGTDAYMSYGGEGALTLDKGVGNGSNAINDVVLTLNLSNYINDDIYLSFSWADHNDEENPSDKVWVRGNANDDWVEIYDFDPELFTDNAFHDVNDLDIDETLANASPSQTVSSTFQLRFGQQDNYWANYDGITIDNIVISDVPQNETSPITLPFVEDWESFNGVVKRDTVIYLSNYSWQFQTSIQNQGEFSWGTNAYMAYNGDGALTLDKRVGNGSYAINYAILTLNLADYSASSDLELSFYWADHNDEENVNDKVWIRGSDVDDWVQIVDLNPESFADNTYHLVDGLDIDATLAAASPAQAVSETFQVRFGQEDNYWANYDGISFDDITIEENTDKRVKANTSNEEDNIQIYYSNEAITIQSFGDAINEEKIVFVYDMYGRTVLSTKIQPSSLTRIKVEPCSCYLVVKVIGENQMVIKKIFTN